MKRFLSILLAILMLAVMLPVTAMAAEVEVSTYEQMKTVLANPGTYVKLTTDIDTTPITFKKLDVVEAADNCTIDLNGFTFKAKNCTVAFEGNNLTIKNGKFDSNGGSYALFVGDEGDSKNVVVENIETNGGINIYNASVTLRNVTSAGTNYYSVWCDEGSFVTIESGEYSSNGSAVLGMASLKPAVKVDLTVNGGKFYVSEKQSLVLPGTEGEARGTPSITGGTFYATPEQMEKIKEYIPTNSELTQTGDGFTVVPKAPTQIVIVPDRTEDTPKTEPEKNPSTGANDVVAAAVALMAVSALGMAVLARKK